MQGVITGKGIVWTPCFARQTATRYYYSTKKQSMFTLIFMHPYLYMMDIGECCL